ncbi:MAG: c-type cytochrome [Verrucomicrobia bacterium]|nr:c-type cytochrome [Verrucomicrobiota bacterium]
MNTRRLSLLLCFSLSASAVLAAPAASANRFTHLDGSDPFYPDANFPKLTTPQWVGEPGVEAVVILAIDDLRDTKKYETFLRPLLERLKQVDGRAPVSIFANSFAPDDPLFQTWLKEGPSLEVHTLAHPCPLLQKGDFDKAAATVHGGVELLNQILGNKPVAFRMPCCDSMNSPSPRFYSEIFNRTSPKGEFLTISSSVMMRFTTNDPSLPRELVLDADGRERFAKYFPSQTNSLTKKSLGEFATWIENYPYPYVVGKLCWEFPSMVPSDWEAFNKLGATNDVMLADWKAALDLTVLKQGVFSFIFHPHGWSSPAQLVEFVDYAQKKYGKRVKFLTFREAQERLNKNLLAGQPLRAADGGDNGVRLLDVNGDGFVDVVIGNDSLRRSRVWNRASGTWSESEFPTVIAGGTGVRFGVVQGGRSASALMRNETTTGAWNFDGTAWLEDKTLLRGLFADGQPVLTSENGRDRGVRFREVNGDGRDELIVGNESQNAIFEWSSEEKQWKKLAYALPKGTSVVDEHGRDAGLRFVGLNGDGFDDVVFSNEKSYGVYTFVPVEKKNVDWRVGWSQIMREGKHGDLGDIPMIVRGGEHPDNGAWFKHGAMWVQNEDTASQPANVKKLTYEQLLSIPGPAPKSPQESLACIQVKKGFKVELVASEPLVMDPVWIDWDARGRMWVVEMADYPLGLDNKGKAGGRIKILEDTDGDGIYDKSTVFIEGLGYPTGLAPWRNGVLIAAAPDIIYAEDTDGDGKADKREVLFTGFHVGNPQHLLNGFCYGLDGWFYGANGDSGGGVTSVKTGKKFDLSSRDFRFKPDTGEFETEPGRTQYGRWRDDWGNWFGNNNSVWAWHYFLPERYLARNPNLAVKATRQATATYAEPKRIYPISAGMRRFNWPDAVNTLTSGCNAMPYRDDLFGPDYATSLFICEPANNLVHREVLEPDGVSFTSHRAADEQTSEFLASTDNWFRPTMARTGPDGALYVVDMYRLVLEHPQWIPEEMIKRLDLRAGEDKGRIYRVAPVNEKRRKIPDMSQLAPNDLVAALFWPNGWAHDTAQRLLLESNPTLSQPAVVVMHASVFPKARVQGLATAAELKVLTWAELWAGWQDSNPTVRELAVKLTEKLLSEAQFGVTGRSPSSKFIPANRIEVLLNLVEDANARVRYQLAFTLGEIADARAGEALVKLARGDAKDEQMQIAVLSSAPRHAETMLKMLLAERQTPPAFLIEQLLVLVLDKPDALAAALSQIGVPRDGKFAAWQFDAVAGLLDTLERRKLSLAKFSAGASPALKTSLQKFDGLFAEARKQSDANAADLSALRLLGRGTTEQAQDFERLGRLLRPQFSAAGQQAALAGLARGSGEGISKILLGGWKSYSPSLRLEVANTLLRRQEWIQSLLGAVERGEIPANQISPAHRQKLQASSTAATRERAEKLFGAVNADRAKVIKNYDAVNDLAGDGTRGLAVYRANCIACHKLRGEGNEVGPDLGTAADKTIPQLLEAIFDPNRAVESRYLSYTAVTKGEREVSGIITAETPNSITLKLQGGAEETILRAELKSLTGSGLSLMPEGLEAALKPQDVADLIAYIKGAGAQAAK